MARIKITGYIDSDDLPSEEVDLSDATGLSNLGYERALGVNGSLDRESLANYTLSSLDDPDFEKADD